MPTRGPVVTATIAAAVMIAQQVGGKATRDALFLSNFEVTSLPVMVMVSAAVSFALIFLITGAMSRLGPSRIVPWGFAGSGALHLLEWAMVSLAPKAAAVTVYLHTVVFGLVLISGFWTLLTERFDPRTAKKELGRIAGGATLGGLLGGILAERVGAYFTLSTMLPVLGLLHIAAAVFILRFVTATGIPGMVSQTVPQEVKDPRYGLSVLKEVPYLRHLAALVVVGAVGAALVNYVFKAEAAAAFENGERLVRFFAVFYTVISLATFLVQTTLSSWFLEKAGLTKTIATLPVVLAGTSLGALFFPGLVSAGVVRGGESILRSSLYRSGYEIHYTPIPKRKKRATKTIVDVGFERLGDLLGGALVALILLVASGNSRPTLLFLAIGFGVLGILVTRLLHRGYVNALEESLLNRAVELDVTEVSDRTTRTTLLQTIPGLELDTELIRRVRRAKSGPETLPDPEDDDPLLELLQDLRSADARRVTARLTSKTLPDPILVPQIIRLLAWDQVAEPAVRVLAKMGPRITGQLADALLNPEEHFAIRRRLPRAMAMHATEGSARVLLQGLEDRRFEVRFQCGRALARLRSNGVSIGVTPEQISVVVSKELSISRERWQHRHQGPQPEDTQESIFVDAALEERANRSLEHVFTVLSLIYPREPLRIAFRGLHTDDPSLRGTALEWLETVLPEGLWKNLRPLLEGDAPVSRPKRTREKILEELLLSNDSIQLKLEELREQGKKPD